MYASFKFTIFIKFLFTLIFYGLVSVFGYEWKLRTPYVHAWHKCSFRHKPSCILKHQKDQFVKKNLIHQSSWMFVCMFVLKNREISSQSLYQFLILRDIEKCQVKIIHDVHFEWIYFLWSSSKVNQENQMFFINSIN